MMPAMLNRMLRREGNWGNFLDGFEMVSETPGPPDIEAWWLLLFADHHLLDWI